MLCILIAHDHPLSRAGVAKLLSERLEARVEQAGTIAELHELLAKKEHDVLILDIVMQGGEGLMMIPELRRLHPKMPILVLSNHPERPAGVEAILAGASAYLSKNSDPEELVTAVKELAKGGRYISQELGLALADHLVNTYSRKDPHEKLSAREHSVLVKISQGFTTAEIAEQLKLSPKTVGTYRARILDKMEIGTTAGLTRYVMAHDLAAASD